MGKLLKIVMSVFMLFFIFQVHSNASAEEKITKLTDIKGHWAEKDIQLLLEKGAISGFSDGTFRPNNDITRAEFVKIMVNMFQLQSTNPDSRFSGLLFEDTYTKNKGNYHWATEEIHIAAHLGIVSGTEKNKFSPNAPITREQMAIMINNLIYQATPFPLQELSETPLNEILIINKFKDAPMIYSGAADKINNLVLLKIMYGTGDGYFYPKKTATRAEAAAILSRVLAKASDQGVSIVYPGVYPNHQRAFENLPVEIQDWVREADSWQQTQPPEESHVWYREDATYAAALRISGSGSCLGLQLKRLDQTPDKTTVTFQYTYAIPIGYNCPAYISAQVIVVKLPKTNNGEVRILK
ncbi:S-layer homology domain-containing protein [Bacillus benzoevorans]|uniref:SLH domain-containing protein n=1 Tax=Bacillus benzoevorans TaxID=1456 RepID=A0A7X0LW54_9BACI|nr:S-layer homology domain-containing protein [Bacillus benzoevorans]MBB6446726.1 hypothetical protein [Bacillus benzoevorans]